MSHCPYGVMYTRCLCPFGSGLGPLRVPYSVRLLKLLKPHKNEASSSQPARAYYSAIWMRSRMKVQEKNRFCGLARVTESCSYTYLLLKNPIIYAVPITLNLTTITMARFISQKIHGNTLKTFAKYVSFLAPNIYGL